MGCFFAFPSHFQAHCPFSLEAHFRMGFFVCWFSLHSISKDSKKLLMFPQCINYLCLKNRRNACMKKCNNFTNRTLHKHPVLPHAENVSSQKQLRNMWLLGLHMPNGFVVLFPWSLLKSYLIFKGHCETKFSVLNNKMTNVIYIACLSKLFCCLPSYNTSSMSISHDRSMCWDDPCQYSLRLYYHTRWMSMHSLVYTFIIQFISSIQFIHSVHRSFNLVLLSLFSRLFCVLHQCPLDLM